MLEYLWIFLYNFHILKSLSYYYLLHMYYITNYIIFNFYELLYMPYM